MPDKNITFLLTFYQILGFSSPFQNVYNIYTIGTKASLQIYKTLQTSTADNAHHYTFMCSFRLQYLFSNVSRGKTLFSLESFRKRGWGRCGVAVESRPVIGGRAPGRLRPAAAAGGGGASPAVERRRRGRWTCRHS